MKGKTKDIFVIGLALFSMFFGAGNVIFPPYLGMESGPQWFIGFVCYYIADIGLALAAIFAMLKCGSTEGITRRIGKVPSAVLMTAIVLCIGPMLAIPRTGATTYELSIQPLFSGINAVVFSIAFFALILALCIRESSVVDILGKFLTPALFVGLLALIVVGIAKPLGPIALEAKIANVPASGILSGYQTMDVLAALVFGLIILKSAEDKGYSDVKSRSKVVAGSGIVAAVGLLIVYMGLSYLGATVSTMFDSGINRSTLVLSIVESLLGKAGLIIFAIVVGLACITTAVGLTSSAAAYFVKLFDGKISYKALVIIICVCSAVFANFGLDQIVSIASPVLGIVYPPSLVLIVLAFFGQKIKNDNVFRMAALGALLFSILETVASYGVEMPFLKSLPLAEMGFGWAAPAIIFGIIGAFIKSRKKPGVDGDALYDVAL